MMVPVYALFLGGGQRRSLRNETKKSDEMVKQIAIH